MELFCRTSNGFPARIPLRLRRDNRADFLTSCGLLTGRGYDQGRGRYQPLPQLNHCLLIWPWRQVVRAVARPVCGLLEIYWRAPKRLVDGIAVQFCCPFPVPYTVQSTGFEASAPRHRQNGILACLIDTACLQSNTAARAPCDRVTVCHGGEAMQGWIHSVCTSLPSMMRTFIDVSYLSLRGVQRQSNADRHTHSTGTSLGDRSKSKQQGNGRAIGIPIRWLVQAEALRDYCERYWLHSTTQWQWP